MSDIVNLVAECELSDGLLAVVEDSLNKDVYHVYKKDKNVQPNHDAKGVMRYLMHVLHALGYKADKAERALQDEKEKTTKLEAKVKLLEEMVRGFSTDGPDVTLMTRGGDWTILYTLDGRNLYRHQTDKEFTWRPAMSAQEILDNIYKEI